MYDCIIIGGGPIGCYTAGQLAGFGLSCLLLEEHEEIGFPVHCTGIVGEDLVTEYSIPREIIRYQVDNVKVNFPSGETSTLPTSIRPYIINRPGFDQYFADTAMNKGVEFRFGIQAKKIDVTEDGVSVSFHNNDALHTAEGRLCIIATGAMSTLPYTMGISRPSGVYRTVQVEVLMDDISGIELFLGKSVAPGSFAYAVPIEGSRVKIGIISKGSTARSLDALLRLKTMKNRVKCLAGDPKYRRLPFGVPKKTVQGRIIAVGDAACQLKSTTGGGLYYGLRCADILALTILKSRASRDFELKTLEEYERTWKDTFGREIRVGLALRSLLEQVDDSWWNDIHTVLEKPDVKELIREYRDFDYHYKFMFKFFKIPGVRHLLLDLVKSSVTAGKIFMSFLDVMKTPFA